MTWLNRTLAVPSLGIQFRPTFRTHDEIIAAFRPTLDDWAREKVVITVKTPNVTSLAFELSTGIQFTVSSVAFGVGFTYPTEIRERPAALPVLHFASELRPFTDLLDETQRVFVSLLGALLKSGKVEVTKAGLVADASVDATMPPPGVKRFYAHLSAPWGSADQYQGHVIGVISDDGAKKTRAIHGFHFNSEEENLRDVMKIKIDWQTVWSDHVLLTKSDVFPFISGIRSSAIDYFDRFGRGELNYGNRNG